MTRRSPIYNWAAEAASKAREEWDLYLADWERLAEDYTNGCPVNARGKEQGISVYQMIAAPGHTSRLKAYASEELLEFAVSHPPMTRNEFEKHWLGERGLA